MAHYGLLFFVFSEKAARRAMCIARLAGDMDSGTKPPVGSVDFVAVAKQAVDVVLGAYNEPVIVSQAGTCRNEVSADHVFLHAFE